MKEIVWESIAGYNAATWPWQIALAAVAYFLAAVLFFRPCTWAKIAMKVFMVAVSLWIAFVYYMTFGSARDYSNIMTIFWCMMALTWIYDIATHFSSFQRSGRFTAAGIVILFLPLAYPLVSLARGMAFPEMATLLPSSVALFMLGMLIIGIQRACQTVAICSITAAAQKTSRVPKSTCRPSSPPTAATTGPFPG